MTVTVDVISDVICPWCYVGKRRLERAVRDLAGRHEVEVRWHPFQLNPTMPAGGLRAAPIEHLLQAAGHDRQQPRASVLHNRGDLRRRGRPGAGLRRPRSRGLIRRKFHQAQEISPIRRVADRMARTPITGGTYAIHSPRPHRTVGQYANSSGLSGYGDIRGLTVDGVGCRPGAPSPRAAGPPRSQARPGAPETAGVHDQRHEPPIDRRRRHDTGGLDGPGHGERRRLHRARERPPRDPERHVEHRGLGQSHHDRVGESHRRRRGERRVRLERVMISAAAALQYAIFSGLASRCPAGFVADQITRTELQSVDRTTHLRRINDEIHNTL